MPYPLSHPRSTSEQSYVYTMRLLLELRSFIVVRFGRVNVFFTFGLLENRVLFSGRY